MIRVFHHNDADGYAAGFLVKEYEERQIKELRFL